jgi:hypothetical protein
MFDIFKSILKNLLGIILLITTYTLNNNPDDLVNQISRVGTWYKWFFKDSAVPSWITSPTADRVLSGGLLIAAFYCIYPLAAHLFTRIFKSKHSPPIEIRFESGKYNGPGSMMVRDVEFAGHMMRVGLFNNTDKTIKYVTVLVECTIGESNQMPREARFSRTGKTSCDLHPASLEQVDILLWNGGRENPPSTGEVTVRVRAEDTPEVKRVFYFDDSKTDPFFDK